MLAIFGAEFLRARKRKSTFNSQSTFWARPNPFPFRSTVSAARSRSVLKFDLYVQGFSFVAPDAAQYQISGSNAGNVTGRVTGQICAAGNSFAQLHRREFAAAGARVRRRHRSCHHQQRKASARRKSRSRRKRQTATARFTWPISTATIAQAVTHDDAIVAKPAWVPGRLALYYTSYEPGNPDIFYHNLSTGQRRVIAGYSGLNTSAAVSPDGSKVAMILSKSGSPNVWVCNADGSDLKRLTHGHRGFVALLVAGRTMDLFRDQNQRAPACWPRCRRTAARFSAFHTAGAPNPTEPDWSPDGKWIAFTSQTGEFRHLRGAGGRQRDADGAGARRRSVVVAELADAGFQPCGPATATRCLCLTFSRNKSRILAEFREAIPNPLGRNDLILI